MFSLFRRKKVADKKSITPCVCDSGGEPEDSFILHDFTTPATNCKAPRSTSEGALSRLTMSESRSARKGYHRLQAEGSRQEPAAIPSSSTTDHLARIDEAPQRLQLPANGYESASSSTDYSDDYGGFNSDSYDDEDLTCNVCDRSFFSVRHLLQHQQKKRHYGCSICDSIFQNLMALELHKETLDHWSEDELRFRDTDSDDDDDDSFYDNIYDSVIRPRELERLL